MAIDTSDFDKIKELRDRTGAGILDCKAALQASNGQTESAIDWLRKKGVAQAAKRARREAKEGIVAIKLAGSKAALVEVNCETDFVARTDDFKNLAELTIAETLEVGNSAASSEKLTQKIAELSGKIGEKILVRRVQLVETKDGVLFGYTHFNNKLGVVVEIAAAKPETLKNADFQELGKNLAMQVATSNPLCLARAEVSADALEREKAIFNEEVKGKPDNIRDKIVQGKLDKFYQSNCLLEQPFIKEDKQSVQQIVAQVSKKIGDTLQVKRFVRYQLGENIASSA